MMTAKSASDPKSLRLMVGLLIVYAALISTGLGPFITDDHPFRQTQTAITAWYFSSLGDFLTYQSPFFGPPWSVPLEFPLYQALAKGLHVATGLNLHASGRVVSITFFMLCLWLVYDLLRGWRISNPPFVMAAMVLAPLYVYWSRSFMIETTALFFMLLFLALFARIVREGNFSALRLLALLLAGTLAAVVKITTAFPYMVIVGAITAWCLLKALRKRESILGLAQLAVVQLLIMVLAYGWVKHTDAVKMLNPMGQIIASGAMRDWTFGPLAQRVDPNIWFALANNATDMFFPFPRTLAWLKGLQLAGGLALMAYFIRCCTPERRKQVLILCALFLPPPLIFMNLHRIHNYYQMANGLFICLAFGLAAWGAREAAASPAQARRITALYAAALLALCMNSLWYLHYKSSHEGMLLSASQRIRDLTPPGSVIIVTGQDYASVLPYQSERRALMLPDYAPAANVEAALVKLRDSGLKTAMYLACGNKSAERESQVRQTFKLEGREPLERVEDCALYVLSG